MGQIVDMAPAKLLGRPRQRMQIGAHAAFNAARITSARDLAPGTQTDAILSSWNAGPGRDPRVGWQGL